MVMEKKTLQYFKDEVAKDMKFKSYAQVFNADNKHGIEMIIDEAAERYAQYLAGEAWDEGQEDWKECQENYNPYKQKEVKYVKS